MYRVQASKQYKKSLRKLQRSGKINLLKIDQVIDMLSEQTTLPARYRDHALKGEWLGYRECHIEPDSLLIYTVQDEVLILLLADIGSHSELFG